MFKRIEINLAGPICTCEEQDLSWTILWEEGVQLAIICSQCKTKLIVPHRKLVARFILDKPYPGHNKTKSGLTLLPGGKK